MGKKIPGEVLKYLVLESCEDGPTYGYEIVTRIEDITDGNWSPSYGTIYPLIQRLEEEELVTALDDLEAEEKGLETGERNYYTLTDKGLRRLDVSEEERKDFKNLIKGYLKVYEHLRGEEKLQEFLKDI